MGKRHIIGQVVGLFILIILVAYFSQTDETYVKKWDKVIRQPNATTCGAACVKMICDFYKVEVSMSKIVSELRPGNMGSSMLDIKNYAEKLGLNAEGWVLSQQDLGVCNKPIIALINNIHYIVVDSVKNGYVYYRDPIQGRKKVKKYSFYQDWNGESILFEK